MGKSQLKSSGSLGGTDYRDGALERLLESWQLLERESFAGAVYLSGRSVEGMLRAVIWKSDPQIPIGKKSLDTGHNLSELLKRVAALGLLKEEGRDDEFAARVELVAGLWHNDMRFAPTRRILDNWRRKRFVDKHRSMKLAAREFYNACSGIVYRCEALVKG